MNDRDMELNQSYVKIGGTPHALVHTTIPECLKHYAETMPDREAMVFVAPNGLREAVTWSQVYTNSRKIAQALVKLEVRRHEVVAINVRSCPQWLYAAFGTMMAGAIPAGVSFTYTDGSDLIALMDTMKTCSLLIVDPGFDGVNWNILQNILDEYNPDGTVKSEKLPYLRYLLGVAFEDVENAPNVKSFVSLLEEDNSAIILPEIQPDDLSGLFQTSGSTGMPKLVSYTHKATMNIFTSGLLTSLDKKYIFFNDRPFPWIAGYPFSCITGQTRVTFSGFVQIPNPVSYMIETIEKERCSSILALPPLMQELIRRKDSVAEDWPVESILTGGQPLTGEIADCVGKICKQLNCVYASTEFTAATMVTITDPNDFEEYGCGKPLQYPGLEIKIVDGSGKIVPIQQRGEIYLRFDSMFKEYFNDPEKTREVKSEDGWYRTDDIGRLTKEGELFVEGRKSNMIISGTFNVAPEIMEVVIKKFPGIDSVVIVPVPDKGCYQVLCACVIRKPGSDVSEEYLRQCCNNFYTDKRGIFTVLPKFYMFLDKFPMTHTGKTIRKELERLAVERFGIKDSN